MPTNHPPSTPRQKEAGKLHLRIGWTCTVADVWRKRAPPSGWAGWQPVLALDRVSSPRAERAPPDLVFSVPPSSLPAILGSWEHTQGQRIQASEEGPKYQKLRWVSNKRYHLWSSLILKQFCAFARNLRAPILGTSFIDLYDIGASITVICVLTETCSVEKDCWMMNKRFQRKCFLVSPWQPRAGYTYEVCQGWTWRLKDTGCHCSLRSWTLIHFLDI